MIRKLMQLTIIIAVTLMSVAPSFGAIRFRHVTSLYSDGKGNAFKTPEGAACAANSVLIVADTGNGRLLRFTGRDGTFQFEQEYRIADLSSPSRVHVNSKGDIFVLDEKEPRIAHLNPEGVFVNYLKPVGISAPDSFEPRSFALDRSDNLYILDIFGERVLVLNPAGAFLRAVKFPDNYGFISDVAVEPDGTVLLLDAVHCMVYAAAPSAQTFTALTGNLRAYMRFPTNLALDGSGLLFITDQNGGAVVVLNQAGSVLGKQLAKGWKEGFVRYPAQSCIAESGDLFIADRENNRVQIFSVSK